MEEDRRRCLDAGCDGYLTKPIDRDKLTEALAHHLLSREDDPNGVSGSTEVGSDAAAESGTTIGGVERPVIAWGRLISRIGDEDLIEELMPVCLQDNRTRLEQLGEAVKARDVANVKLYAHGLKGAGLNLGVEALAEAAKRLEHQAAAGDLSSAGELLNTIRAEFARFEAFVSQPDWVQIAKRQEAQQPCEGPMCHQKI